MTHEFKTEKGRFLAVGVPERAYDVSVNRHQDQFDRFYISYTHPKISFKGMSNYDNIQIPEDVKGACLLFQLSAAREEDFAKVVEKNSYGHNGWKTYTEELMYREDSASKSFSTLMEREKLYVKNPFGDKEPEDVSDLGAFTQARRGLWRKWKEAQNRVSPDWLVIQIIE